MGEQKKYMATITKENIGLLHEKLTVKLEKTDYLPSFEKSLKEHSKKANIPGFRKGMVPAGLIKKMYGPSLFTGNSSVICKTTNWIFLPSLSLLNRICGSWMSIILLIILFISKLV